MTSKSQTKRLAVQTKSRVIVVYTPSYAFKPFEVAFDSSLKKFAGMDAQLAADLLDRQPAEDPETRIFRLGPAMSNEDFLFALNHSMEIATLRKQRLWEKKEESGYTKKGEDAILAADKQLTDDLKKAKSEPRATKKRRRR